MFIFYYYRIVNDIFCRIVLLNPYVYPKPPFILINVSHGSNVRHFTKIFHFLLYLHSYSRQYSRKLEIQIKENGTLICKINVPFQLHHVDMIYFLRYKWLVGIFHPYLLGFGYFQIADRVKRGAVQSCFCPCPNGRTDFSGVIPRIKFV